MLFFSSSWNIFKITKLYNAKANNLPRNQQKTNISYYDYQEFSGSFHVVTVQHWQGKTGT
jgi:hypothetical protein